MRLLRSLIVAFVTTVAAAQQPARIALEMIEPIERGFVVTDFPASVGLIFPEGDLTTLPGGRVVDDRARAVPFTADCTGWWPAEKRSVKWLLLKFNASSDRRYFFEPGGTPLQPSGDLLATAVGHDLKVNTGPLAVHLTAQGGQLFKDVRLHDQPILSPLNEPCVLVVEEAAGLARTECKLDACVRVLEENTAARAVVKISGGFVKPGGDKVAQLDLRMQFSKGESFVRLYHTLTWLVKDTRLGIRDLALRLNPATAASRTRIGLSDFTAASLDVPLAATSRVLALQQEAEQFTVSAEGREPAKGRHLGGWMALEDDKGRGMGVSLRHAWQMFPSAFAVETGELRVKLWPNEAGRMGFDYADIMPPDFYHKDEWKRFPWSKDKGHFEHEALKYPAFLHTAEGAARTHEMTLFFYDRASTRTMAQLNSLTQHPLAIRQDPRSALRVPFMSFNLDGADASRYPDVEHAIEQAGRMVTARWPQIHDYGWWRFGMIRWAVPGGTLYRWFDGTQYDQQLVPWLLWLRGGGREFFEEAEATTRFAMDVCTNHYNTRGVPTGFMTQSAGMPFPWESRHLHKAMKVHFLAHCHHLTGYSRAKETLDEVIAGTQAAAVKDPQVNPVIRRGWAREVYNMNTFWANAWEETGAAELKTLSREWLGLSLNREFNPQFKSFRNPQVYLYQGLLLQQQLFNDAPARDAMLQNLASLGYPNLEDGGVWDIEVAIACGWAYQQTQDPRFVRIAWDIARAMADLVPDHDWKSPEVPPRWPYAGNQNYRMVLTPIITGTALAAKAGLRMDEPFVRRDTFVSLATDAKGRAVGEVLLRPNADGDLAVRILLTTAVETPAKPVTVTAHDAAGQKLAEAVLTMQPAAQTPERHFVPKWSCAEARLTLPNIKRGGIYTLRLEGTPNPKPVALILADAQIVHHLPAGAIADFHQEAGQNYGGARVFTQTLQEPVKITNTNRVPFTIRDARTHELLFRSTTADTETTEHRLGKNRLIFLTVPGRLNEFRFEGLSPYLSATREGWFDPGL